MRDLKALGKILDSQFKLGKFRFGLDGIIGLIPFVGDVATGAASLYIVGRAHSMGVPYIILVRMLGNILIESLVGTIPVFGNLFDFFWKSNLKNIKLIDSYNHKAQSTLRRSWASVIMFSILLFSVFFLFAVLLFKLLSYLLSLI